MAIAHRLSASQVLLKARLCTFFIWHVPRRLCILAGVLQLCYAITFERSIALREFSLVTKRGENVLQLNFNRRRLRHSANNRLALAFDAFEQRFEFEFEPSYPIFAPGARIKITRRVSARTSMVQAHRS